MRRDVRKHPAQAIEKRCDVAREVGGLGADAIRRRRHCRRGRGSGASVAVSAFLVLSPPLLYALPGPGEGVRYGTLAVWAGGRVLLQVSRVAC